MTIPILLLISILYVLKVYKVDCVYIGKMVKENNGTSLDYIKKEVLKAGEDFSKSAINGAIEKIKMELEQNLKDALNKKKSDFEKKILDNIDARINASSIQNYLKQLNPSYVLPKPNVGGSSSKYIKRKRKTKKNPKRIQKKAKNKTKKRQQGGSFLTHAFVEYFSQSSGKIKETITSSL